MNFDTCQTGFEPYDSMLNGTYFDTYYARTEYKWQIEYMSPEEYIIRCNKLKCWGDNRYLSPKQIDSIEEGVNNNAIFLMPFLDYIEKEQEGRHRTEVAKNRNVEQIPVFVIEEKGKNTTILYDPDKPKNCKFSLKHWIRLFLNRITGTKKRKKGVK
jgi:hypothetical protein